MSPQAFGAVWDAPHAMGDGEKQDHREPFGAEKATLREIRVSVKCKGTKRRIDKKRLVAYVDEMWSPRHERLTNAKKRSSVKRGKPPFAKVDQIVVVGSSSRTNTAGEMIEDEVGDQQSDGLPGIPDTPGQGGNKSEDCGFIPRRQSLPENLRSEAEDRTEQSSFIPSLSPGPAVEAVADPGMFVTPLCHLSRNRRRYRQVYDRTFCCCHHWRRYHFTTGRQFRR